MEEFENNVNASQYASPIIELCVTTTIQLAEIYIIALNGLFVNLHEIIMHYAVTSIETGWRIFLLQTGLQIPKSMWPNSIYIAP